MTCPSIRSLHRSIGLATLIALAIVACERGDPSGTATETGLASPDSSAEAGGQPEGMQTAAPLQSETEPAGTARPTAEAAAAATAAAAALLPQVIDSWGQPGSEPGQMTLPFDVAADGQGHLYVSDSTGVSKYTEEGDFVLRVGEGDLPMAEGLAVGPDGLLYVSGYGALVRVYDAEGRLQGEIGQAGEGPGQLLEPTDLAFDGQGNLLVADAGNRYLLRFSPQGQLLGSIGEPGEQSGQFTAPRSVAVDAEDRIYVGMGDDFLLQRFSPDGSYLDSFGQGSLDETLFRVGGVAVDPEIPIAYVSQSVGHKIQAFDMRQDPARLLWELGGRPGMRRGELTGPTGLDFSEGKLFVADTSNHRIQVFDVSQVGRSSFDE